MSFDKTLFTPNSFLGIEIFRPWKWYLPALCEHYRSFFPSALKGHKLFAAMDDCIFNHPVLTFLSNFRQCMNTPPKYLFKGKVSLLAVARPVKKLCCWRLHCLQLMALPPALGRAPQLPLPSHNPRQGPLQPPQPLSQANRFPQPRAGLRGKEACFALGHPATLCILTLSFSC